MMNTKRARRSAVLALFVTLCILCPPLAASSRSGSRSRISPTRRATLGTVPAAPGGLAASPVSSSQINLSWTDNSMNETSFVVERAMTPTGSWSAIGTTAASVVSYSDTGLAGATTCYYRVRATNAAGNSAYSNAASATTPAGAPLAPSGLSATASSPTQIDLGWTDNSSNETGFKVERAPSSTGAWTQIGTTGSVASFADTSVAASTTYYYRVRATNAVGDSGYSNTANDTTPTPAAAGTVSWAKKFGAQVLTDASYVTGVAVDAGGNIFTAGRFTGSANLGGGVVTSGVGYYDVFIAKYGPDGTYRWAKHFNSNSVPNRTGSIAMDSAGNVVVTGAFFNTLDFGAPCAPITAYSMDTFLVKFSSSGACLWARNFTSNNTDSGTGVAVDGSDNIVLVGALKGTLDFGSGVSLTGRSTTQSDIYLAKLNPSGGILWAHNYGGTTNNAQIAYDVATDSSGNIVMTGSFQSTVDFCAPGSACPLTAAVNPISGPSNDAFIAKYTSGGAAVWTKSFGESQGGDQVGQAVSFDSAGNVLATGYVGGTINFGTGIQNPRGYLDLYVVKIASAGTTTWARRYGSSGFEQFAYDLAVDNNDDVVVAAKSSGPLDFGGGPLPNPDGSTGRTNALGLKLSSAGSYIWAKGFGDNWFQSSRAVTTDGSANAIFAGVFASTIDFGTGALSSPGTSTDSIFVVKFGS